MEITINQIVCVKANKKTKLPKIIKAVADFVYGIQDNKLVILKSRYDSTHYNLDVPTYLLMQDLFRTPAGTIFQIINDEVIYNGLTKLKPSDITNNPSMFKRLN